MIHCYSIYWLEKLSDNAASASSSQPITDIVSQYLQAYARCLWRHGHLGRLHTNCVKTSIKTWDKRDKSWCQHHHWDQCAAVFIISFVSTVLLSLRHVTDIVSWLLHVFTHAGVRPTLEVDVIVCTWGWEGVHDISSYHVNQAKVLTCLSCLHVYRVPLFTNFINFYVKFMWLFCIMYVFSCQNFHDLPFPQDLANTFK
jgi:hypothetical protein